MFKCLLKNLFLLVIMFVAFVVLGNLFAMFVNFAMVHRWVVVVVSVIAIALVMFVATYQCD